MGKRLKLYKLVEEFDSEFERLREGESHADFKSRYGNPVSRGPLGPLDEHAATVFTRAIYIKIKHQMDMSYALNNVGVNDVQNIRMYTIARYMRQDAIRTVVYNADDNTYKCSCKHFESYEYPCRHIIHVLKIRNVEHFPDRLILKRWTKVAKDDINISGADSIPLEMQVTVRYGAISSLCNRIARLSSQTSERFNEVRLGMTKMLDDLIRESTEDANSTQSGIMIRNPTVPPSSRQAGRGATSDGSTIGAASQTTAAPKNAPSNIASGRGMSIGVNPPNADNSSAGQRNTSTVLAKERKCTI